MSRQSNRTTTLCQIHKQAPVLEHGRMMGLAKGAADNGRDPPGSGRDRLAGQVGFEIAGQVQPHSGSEDPPAFAGT